MAYAPSWFSTQLFASDQESTSKERKKLQQAPTHKIDWSNSGIIQKELEWQKSVIPY